MYMYMYMYMYMLSVVSCLPARCVRHVCHVTIRSDVVHAAGAST